MTEVCTYIVGNFDERNRLLQWEGGATKARVFPPRACEISVNISQATKRKTVQVSEGKRVCFSGKQQQLSLGGCANFEGRSGLQ